MARRPCFGRISSRRFQGDEAMTSASRTGLPRSALAPFGRTLRQQGKIQGNANASTSFPYCKSPILRELRLFIAAEDGVEQETTGNSDRNTGKNVAEHQVAKNIRSAVVYFRNPSFGCICDRFDFMFGVGICIFDTCGQQVIGQSGRQPHDSQLRITDISQLPGPAARRNSLVSPGYVDRSNWCFVFVEE